MACTYLKHQDIYPHPKREDVGVNGPIPIVKLLLKTQRPGFWGFCAADQVGVLGARWPREDTEAVSVL